MAMGGVTRWVRRQGQRFPSMVRSRVWSRSRSRWRRRGGRIHIRWDHEASATPNAQLAFFAEFLATTGVYESWVNSCPLRYTSGNAPHKRDVLGTWFLSILAGHHRYAHITGLRGDGLSPQGPWHE